MYENATNIGNEPECNECRNLEREKDKLERKLAAIVRWLEVKQPDVFSRGLWDSIKEANTESEALT